MMRCGCFEDVDDDLAPFSSLEATCQISATHRRLPRERKVLVASCEHGRTRATTVYPGSNEWDEAAKYPTHDPAEESQGTAVGLTASIRLPKLAA